MRRTRSPRPRPSAKRRTCDRTVADRYRDRDRHVIEFICRRAVRTSHASAGSSRVGPRHGQGCRGARVGPAMRAAGGMQVSRGRPGAWPSSVSSRFRSTAPLRGSVPRAALSHGRRPRSRPALAHRGPWARASSPRRFTARFAPVCSALRAQPPTPMAPCVPAPARLSGRPLPAWQALPRAPHGTPAHGATALGSCACVSCAHRRRQRRRQRRSPCPGRP